MGEYRTITVKEELYNKLKEMADREGFSIPDFINHMLILYRDFMSWAVKLSRLVYAMPSPAPVTPASVQLPQPTAPEEEAVSEKMTERQVGLIKKLLKEVYEKTGLGFDTLRDMAREELGFEISWDMTKEQASKVIDWLKKQLEG